MPQTVLDKIDLTIINSLSVDCRIPYRNIASIVGITPNAVKERINKMTSNGIIQNFVVRVNPVIFGYEKECILTVRYTDKTIKEEDIVNRLNLLGDVLHPTEPANYTRSYTAKYRVIIVGILKKGVIKRSR
jgi:DNA-binding Lrp family transcriptional regulator